MNQRQNKPQRKASYNNTQGINPYYSADSSARQLRTEETFAPQPNPQKRYKKVATKSRKPFVDDIQEKLRHHFLSYMVILAFFGGVAGVLALNARLDQAVAQREAASHELATLTTSNIARRGEMEASVDSAALEHYAIYTLGMVRPEEFQRVEVSVPRQAYLVGYHEPAASGFSLARIWDSIFSVTAQN